MDKSLKVAEDEWWERERERAQNFVPQIRSEL